MRVGAEVVGGKGLEEGYLVCCGRGRGEGDVMWGGVGEMGKGGGGG